MSWMWSTNVAALLGAIVLLSISSRAQAEEPHEIAIYIKCSTGTETRRGTGVLVSSDGSVLTAKHVVYGNKGNDPAYVSATVCQGSRREVGVAERQLGVLAVSATHDAILLRYPGHEEGGLPFAKYCPVTKDYRRAEILASGFPRTTKTGVLSQRKGILSTTVASALTGGLLETDALTTTGMSGGLITLLQSNHLIGIISGVQPDSSTGWPSFYGILPVTRILGDLAGFNFQKAPDGACDLKSRVTAIKPIDLDDTVQTIELDMHEKDGFCFITGVWGVWNNASDSAKVTTNGEGQYFLEGRKNGAGVAGVNVQCVRY